MRSGDNFVTKICEACNAQYKSIANSRICYTCGPDYSQRLRYRNYGITAPQYQNLLESQGFCCAVCSKDLTHNGIGKTPQRLDHDHSTGKIRGIVCQKCNAYLAALDEPGWLKNGLSYIGRSRE